MGVGGIRKEEYVSSELSTCLAGRPVPMRVIPVLESNVTVGCASGWPTTPAVSVASSAMEDGKISSSVITGLTDVWKSNPGDISQCQSLCASPSHASLVRHGYPRQLARPINYTHTMCPSIDRRHHE